MDKNKILFLLFIILIFTSISILTTAYILNKVNYCTSKPLEYAVKKYHQFYDGRIYGVLYVTTKNYMNSQEIYFFGDINKTSNE